MSKLGRNILLLTVPAALAAGCQQGDDKAGSNAASNNAAGVEASQTTIAQTLAGSADYSTLVSAIKAAGLEATMSGSQPYTLFAPTNAAFQKLPAGAAEGLMQPDQKGQLTALLTNHIVPGLVTAEDLSRAIKSGGGKAQIATVGGGTLTATESGGAIMIGDGASAQARVTPGGQAQSNGAMHSVDTVLTPSQSGAPPAQ